MGDVEIVAADTELGRLAIAEVMERSYAVDLDSVPGAWARALVVDGVPVSFIVVDPDRRMENPYGDVRYAFIRDVATREDRRGEGHFHSIMEHTFSSLRATEVPVVILHGRYQLYRRFGFEVFTHHCGIFTSPEQIERSLGTRTAEEASEWLVAEEGEHVQEDLLLVADVKATTLSESKRALQAAAALARRREKERILFEHPAAPSYGSRYPIHPSLETRFTALARGCGAQIRVQGADPENGRIPDADWIKVLSTSAFLREALRELKPWRRALPEAAVCFQNDAGGATLLGTGGSVTVSDAIESGAARVEWPSWALAQLVTGYKSTETLSVLYGTSLAAEEMALLEELFPRRWRLSRNESWTFRS